MRKLFAVVLAALVVAGGFIADTVSAWWGRLVPEEPARDPIAANNVPADDRNQVVVMLGGGHDNQAYVTARDLGQPKNN